MPTRRRPLAPVNPTRVGQPLLIGHCCRWSAIAVISRMIAPLLLGGRVGVPRAKFRKLFLSQPRNFQFLRPGFGSWSFLRTRPSWAQPRGDVAGCDLVVQI